MVSLREEIAEALTTAIEQGTGDVDALATAVRDRLMACHWMHLLLREKFQQIANDYPADVFTVGGATPDGIAGTAIRLRMQAEIRVLADLADHADELDALRPEPS